jgi:hypothetical protein
MYAKSQHKHILLVREFIKQNEPEGRVYALDGQADAVEIRVVKDSMFPKEHNVKT